MADVKWIKLATNIFDNRKIKQIEALPDGDSIIVVWVKLMCLAGNINDSGFLYFTKEIPYTEQMLAAQFNRPLTTVQMALRTFKQFGMIEIIDNVLHISNWEKYQSADKLADIREYNRIAKQKSRERLKALQSVNDKSMTCQPCQDTDKDIEEDIRLKNNTNSASQPSKADVDAFFESIWNLYPVKKGKGQVSDTKRKALYKIGFDAMKTAIDRYLTELKKDASWRKPQNGSTFFNSGYVDYLDGNYVPAETETQPIKQSNYHKQTKAEELDEAYQMMAAWGEGG